MEEGLLTQIPCATKELFSKLDNSYEIYLVKHDLRCELETQLEKYISVLNHDIKTPALAQMRALEYLLAENQEGLSENQRDLLNMTLESCQEQYDIINNLINTLKYKKQENVIVCSSFNIIELVKNNLGKLEKTIKRNNNNIIFKSDSPEININADMDKLSGALYKLMKYALNRASNDSAINIEISENEQQSNIIINIEEKTPSSYSGLTCSGVYISQEDYNSVGSNLELGLVEEIVSAHNGSLNRSQSGNHQSIELILPKKYVQY